eukprot:2250606-Rhodomonas_salina.1
MSLSGYSTEVALGSSLEFLTAISSLIPSQQRVSKSLADDRTQCDDQHNCTATFNNGISLSTSWRDQRELVERAGVPKPST